MRQPASNEGTGDLKPIPAGFLGPQGRRVARETVRTGKPPKKAGALALLNELSAFRPNTFENRFSRQATFLNLGLVFTRADLISLFEAAFAATLCNLAFNGRGGCRGVIKPERELHRMNLERMFMAARNRFIAAPNYKALPPSQKALIHSNLLFVSVAESNLAKEV